MRLMRRPRLDSPLARLRNQIDEMFEQPDFPLRDLFTGWTPAVDVLEDKDKLTVKAELPGFKKEDLNVTLHENNLIISGERRCEDRRAPKVTVTQSGESEGVVAPKHLLPGFCCCCSGTWALEQGPSGTRSRPAAELSEPQLAAAGRVECE